MSVESWMGQAERIAPSPSPMNDADHARTHVYATAIMDTVNGLRPIGADRVLALKACLAIAVTIAVYDGADSDPVAPFDVCLDELTRARERAVEGMRDQGKRS